MNRGQPRRRTRPNNVSPVFSSLERQRALLRLFMTPPSHRRAVGSDGSIPERAKGSGRTNHLSTVDIDTGREVWRGALNSRLAVKVFPRKGPDVRSSIALYEQTQSKSVTFE
jgi:hypothetical protein